MKEKNITIFSHCGQYGNLQEVHSKEDASCEGEVYDVTVLCSIINGRPVECGVLLSAGNVCTKHMANLITLGQQKYFQFTIAEKELVGTIGWMTGETETNLNWAGYL